MSTHLGWYSGDLIRELFTGSKPYETWSCQQIRGCVGFYDEHKIEFPDNISVPLVLKKLMLKCLSRNPHNRGKFSEIVVELAHIQTVIQKLNDANENLRKFFEI